MYKFYFGETDSDPQCLLRSNFYKKPPIEEFLKILRTDTWAASDFIPYFFFFFLKSCCAKTEQDNLEQVHRKWFA